MYWLFDDLCISWTIIQFVAAFMQEPRENTEVVTRLVCPSLGLYFLSTLFPYQNLSHGDNSPFFYCLLSLNFLRLPPTQFSAVLSLLR